MLSFSRAAFAALLAQIFILPFLTNASGLFESEMYRMERRQNAVNGNVCATVELSLLGIDIANGVCICAQAGALTPASLTTISTQVTAHQGILAPVLVSVGGLTGAITQVAANTLPLVLNSPTTCRYPANSTPNTCGSCGYACYQNATVTYVACGSSCILQGAPCVSGIPGRKRALETAALPFDTRCPSPLEACIIPSTSGKLSMDAASSYECLDTQSNLESCGGCVDPISGRAKGQDCSAIPNTQSVACRSGQCVVKCQKGFQLENNACVPTKSATGLRGYWAALEQGAKVVVV